MPAGMRASLVACNDDEVDLHAMLLQEPTRSSSLPHIGSRMNASTLHWPDASSYQMAAVLFQ